MGTVQGSKTYFPPDSEDVQFFGAKEVVAEELAAIRKRRKERGLSDDPSLKTHDLCDLPFPVAA